MELNSINICVYKSYENNDKAITTPQLCAAEKMN